MNNKKIYEIIVNEIKSYSGITFVEMIENDKSRCVSQPRQVLHYLLTRYLDKTPDELASLLWRSKTTIAKNCNLIKVRLGMESFEKSPEIIYCNKIIKKLNLLINKEL